MLELDESVTVSLKVVSVLPPAVFATAFIWEQTWPAVISNAVETNSRVSAAATVVQVIVGTLLRRMLSKYA